RGPRREERAQRNPCGRRDELRWRHHTSAAGLCPSPAVRGGRRQAGRTVRLVKHRAALRRNTARGQSRTYPKRAIAPSPRCQAAMNVLVLDGNQNQAVASVRSLARAGHTVFVGEAASWSKASWSRVSSGAFQYPSPQGPIGPFVEAIADFVRKRSGILVLPMTEATTLSLCAHRDFLVSAGARLVLPDHRDLLRAFDKNETTRLAASLGVAVPKTVVVTTPEQARDAAHCMRYPIVLKPLASEELSSDGNLRTTGRPCYANDAVECDKAYRSISLRSSTALFQEFVAGEGTGYFALMRHGELRAEFAHRRIRDVHPT